MIKTLPILITVFFIFNGCSIIAKEKTLEPQPREGWKRIKVDHWGAGVLQIGNFYEYKYICNGVSIKANEIGISGYGAFGPPLLPILFIPFNVYGDKFILQISLSAVNGGQYKFSAPKVEIKQPMVEGSLSPIRMDEPLNNYFDYYFDLKKEEVEAFDLIFVSKVNDCVIPKLSFMLNRNTVYSPLVVPTP